MADFSDTMVQPVRNAVTPPTPVQDNSAAVSAAAIGTGIQNGLNILGNTLRGHFANKQAAAGSAAVNGLTMDLQKLGSLRERGLISQEEFNTRASTTFVGYAANNPGAEKDLRTTYSNLAGKAPGFGQETAVTAFQKEQEEGALKAGYIIPFMNDEDRAEAMEQYRVDSAEIERLQMEGKKLDAQMKRNNLSEQERKMAQAQYDAEVTSSVPRLANSSFKTAKRNVDTIIAAVQNGSMSQEEALIAVQEMKLQLQQQSAAFASGASSDTRSMVEANMETVFGIFDLATARLDNSMSSEMYSNQVKSANSKMLLTLYARSPQAHASIAISEVAPSMAEPLLAMTGGMEILAEFVANPAAVVVTDGSQPQVSQGLFKGLNTTATQLQQGTGNFNNPSLAKQQWEQSNAGILQSIRANDGKYQSPKELNEVVNYLAGPGFAQAAPMMSPEDKAAALDVLQRHYVASLQDTVGQVLSEDASIFTGTGFTAERFRTGEAPTGSVMDMVTMEVVGDRVVFKAKDPNNHAADVAVRKLNKDMAPALVKISQAVANLSGVSFGEAFEQVAGDTGLKQLAPAPETGATEAPAVSEGDTTGDIQKALQNPSEGVEPGMVIDARDAEDLKARNAEENERLREEGRVVIYDGPGSTIDARDVEPRSNAEISSGFNTAEAGQVGGELQQGLATNAQDVKSVTTEVFAPVDMPTNTIDGAQEPVQADRFEEIKQLPALQPAQPIVDNTDEAGIKEVAKEVKLSRADITKAGRKAATEAGFDPDTPEGMAYSSKVQRQLLKQQKSLGSKVSKELKRVNENYQSGKVSSAAPKIPAGEVANYVGGGLVERGLPQHVAEGFLMNMMHESGFDPDINEKAPLVKGSRGGYGLYQLTGPRRRQFEKYAEATGRETYDIDAQLDFLMWELENTESRAFDKIMATGNSREAAIAIVKHFLRPAPENEAKRIKKYRGA